MNAEHPVSNLPFSPPWNQAANSGPGQVTQTVRAGIECDDTTGCVVPPLHLTSTFAFRGFGEKRDYDYTRSGNPTRDLLGKALAELEQGAGAVVTASGMAAVTVVGYLVPAGARIVAPHDCYGGTYRLFDAWRRRGERQVEFVDFGDEAALARRAVAARGARVDRDPEQSAAAHHRHRRSRRARPCAAARWWWWTTPSCHRAGSSRSPSARTWWCTRPPST